MAEIRVRPGGGGNLQKREAQGRGHSSLAECTTRVLASLGGSATSVLSADRSFSEE